MISNSAFPGWFSILLNEKRLENKDGGKVVFVNFSLAFLRIRAKKTKTPLKKVNTKALTFA